MHDYQRRHKTNELGMLCRQGARVTGGWGAQASVIVLECCNDRGGIDAVPLGADIGQYTLVYIITTISTRCQVLPAVPWKTRSTQISRRNASCVMATLLALASVASSPRQAVKNLKDIGARICPSLLGGAGATEELQVG
ncbi:hypothetical protein CCMA1212_008344 [Trichoderma ghanense]|uniref:SSCRP protein n=1 Tax=Trichoderma ghanense TaxID=65468 RepID=A0ABY2GY43_9HYPO